MEDLGDRFAIPSSVEDILDLELKGPLTSTPENAAQKEEILGYLRRRLPDEVLELTRRNVLMIVTRRVHVPRPLRVRGQYRQGPD